MRNLKIVLAVAAVLALAGQPAAGADYTWNGGAGEDWDTAANWLPTDGPPLPANTVDVLTGTPSDADGISVLGATASITISGADTVVTYDTGAGSTYGLLVGNGNDSGTVEINTGGTATGTKGCIGGSAGTGTGYVKVTGDDGSGNGSSWDMTGLLYVGYANKGTLDVLAGGDVAAGTVTMAYSSLCDSDNPGTLLVSGAGSTFTSAGVVQVGGSGTAILNVTAGGVATATQWIIGGVSSTATVSAGGILNNTTGGGDSRIQSGSTIHVTGTGSTWNNTGANRVLVGLSGATSTLAVSDNGEVNIDGELKMYGHINTSILKCDIATGGSFTKIEVGTITIDTAGGTYLDMGGEDNTVLGTWYPLLTGAANTTSMGNLVLHPDDVVVSGVGWEMKWEGTGAKTLSATYIPEPATLALLGLGGLGVLIRRRRK